MTVQTPLTDRIVVLVGGFATKLAKQEYEDMLILMGAQFRRKLSGSTEVLIAGSRAGGAIERAQQQGTEVLDEEQLQQVIADFLAARREISNNIASNPLVPAIALGMEYGDPDSILFGKRLVCEAHGEVNGELFAYYATTALNTTSNYRNANRQALASCSGAETLECVVLDQYDQTAWDAFIDTVATTPNIRGLAVVNSPITLDLEQVFANLPNLQALHVENVTRVECPVVRHSNLQQLVLLTEQVQGLDCLSAPQLSYLHLQANAELPDQLNRAFDCLQFPALKHLGVTGYEQLAELLAAVTMPTSLFALTLNYTDEGRYTNRVVVLQPDLKRLAEHTLAKQITHLTLQHNGYLLFPELTRANFPKLTHLAFRAVSNQNGASNIEEHIAELLMTEGLHLDLQRCNLGGHNIDPLLAALAAMPPLASLNLAYNHIVTRQTLATIADAPYEVNIDHQRRYS